MLAVKKRPAPAQQDQVLTGLREQLRECVDALAHNQMLFDLEIEPELIEQRIYEREAQRCRYRYLQRLARQAGVRALRWPG